MFARRERGQQEARQPSLALTLRVDGSRTSRQKRRIGNLSEGSMEAERAGRAKAADTSTTLNGRVGEEARRQPEEGRRRVARPEKGSTDTPLAHKRSVIGTREPEVGWEREKSGIGFGHSAVRGPAVFRVCSCITVKPPSVPARFLLATKPTNYAPIMSACGTEEGPSDLNHSFTEIEFYVRGFLPAERREDMC